MTVLKNAMVYRTKTREFFPGDVRMSNGVFGGEGRADETVDVGGAYVIPGLIDVHTHGRAGGDFASADEAMLRKMATSYLASGVTSVMPTFASAPLEELYAAADRVNRVRPATGGARFLGTHLEGRYLNPTKRGAHAPELLVLPNGEEVEGLIARMGLPAHVSAALELDRDGSFAEAVLTAGATLSLGHTAATYDEATRAFANGATAATHLFNCMPPLHHREGGAVAAALTEGAYCEVIADGFHISPPMVKLAYRAADAGKFVLITDSMEATGCPDGEYSIAGMPVTVKDGKALTHDGAIAGSTLSLYDGVRNLCLFAGIPFGEAVYAATEAPAEEIGVSDTVGSIADGKWADCLVVDPDTLEIRDVYLGGKKQRI